MAMLHEVLAVGEDLEKTYKTIVDETKNTFSKKAEHFLGQHKKLEMFVEDNLQHPETHKKMDTTVRQKLDHLQITAEHYFNGLLQKEATNQVAVADLIIDDIVICKDLPVTFLLGMEKRLIKLKDVYMAIPTLQPGIEWKKDPELGEDVWRIVHPDEKLKTETIVEPIVLYDATPEHPAQVKEMSKTSTVGRYITTIWSGMVSPAEKSVLLGKLDKLIIAFKKARQRANTTKVVNQTIGKELFDFINSK